MPRRNRREPDEPTPLRFSRSTTDISAPPGWEAHLHHGGPDPKDYVCPRCHRTVARTTEHVVATPDAGQRRHWHTACWRSAVKEGVDRYRH